MQQKAPHLMQGHRFLSAIAACLLLACCGGAQKTLHPDMSQATPLVQPSRHAKQISLEEQLARLNAVRKTGNYKFTLGKGDMLAISVYSEPDLSVNSLPVRPDGKISFPLVGDIVAEGRTVDELKAKLTKELEQYVRGPKVAVIVQQFSSLEYTIAGEVVKPGTYPLVTDVTLTKAVARAGGLAKGQFHATSVEVADLSHAFLARNGEVLPINFSRLLREGDMRFDIALLPGDYIYIPSGLTKEVYILGEVQKADLFAFREGLTVAHALAMATGFTPDADIANVHIIRGSLSNPQLFIVDMEDMLKGTVKDMELMAGDIVYVPPTGLTSWSRILQKLLPSIQAIQTGIILQRGI